VRCLRHTLYVPPHFMATTASSLLRNQVLESMCRVRNKVNVGCGFCLPIMQGVNAGLTRQVCKQRHVPMTPRHQIVSSEMKRRATSMRCNSLPGGIASQPEFQPGASTRSPWNGQNLGLPKTGCRLNAGCGDPHSHRR